MVALLNHPRAALVFDFDGVILDSASLKREAFAALYDDYPDVQREAIRAYLGRRGGQPREVKFRHIESHILGRDVRAADIDALCARFKAVVAERIRVAPAIPGAIEFLSRWHGRLPLYLLSATPGHELREIVEQRDLARYFEAVIGAPPDKVTGMRNLLERYRHPAAHTVMIGDSYNDYRTARGNGTRFVGVCADPSASPFPDDVATIRNLRRLEAALARLSP
ncbi:Phosphoglycolate phosphatase, HAD superfamily [Franzmannia pantelleriensis]|uniref:phosphoglycolate phosphatase n=1 Tax=Franzmannia pantelleriensis TaxID=48727 RepID=A0A1G9SNT1_9GAMM|nr:HAD family hydrolase [Halomonas pantelleriensis]SDM37106.1 Phosphoglycolate phosphatase, HAD superfamily [Halomonas pantelleriensis]